MNKKSYSYDEADGATVNDRATGVLVRDVASDRRPYRVPGGKVVIRYGDLSEFDRGEVSVRGKVVFDQAWQSLQAGVFLRDSSPGEAVLLADEWVGAGFFRLVMVV